MAGAAAVRGPDVRRVFADRADGVVAILTGTVGIGVVELADGP